MKLRHFCQLKGFNKCSKPQRQQAFRSTAQLLFPTTKPIMQPKSLSLSLSSNISLFLCFILKTLNCWIIKKKKKLATNFTLVYRVFCCSMCTYILLCSITTLFTDILLCKHKSILSIIILLKFCNLMSYETPCESKNKQVSDMFIL